MDRVIPPDETDLVGEQQVTHRLVLRILHHSCDDLQHGSDSWKNIQRFTVEKRKAELCGQKYVDICVSSWFETSHTITIKQLKFNFVILSREASNQKCIITVRSIKFLDKYISGLVYKMSEIGEKCRSLTSRISCFAHKPKTFSLLSERRTETTKYSHLMSWNQKVLKESIKLA